MSRDQLRLILGTVIPNMKNGFHIKTDDGEVLRLDPDRPCCQAFIAALAHELQQQLQQPLPQPPSYRRLR